MIAGSTRGKICRSHSAAVQVRVVQGKEPNHFLTLFKGRMVVHSGGRASAFKNRADSDSYDVDGVSLIEPESEPGER